MVAAVAVVLAAGTALWACGPFFPNRLLVTGDAGLVWMPAADFRREIEQLLPPGEPAFRAKPPNDNTYYNYGTFAKQTAEADVADLQAALEQRNVPSQERETLMARYRAARESLRGHAVEWDYWKTRVRYDPNLQPPPLDTVTVPDGLPGEFADYLRGAILYYQNRPEEARAAWQTVLDRPPAERHYRSTWAAFMIGKSWLDSDPAQAAAWFERVRTLAKESYADTLGLAASSLGWQAKAELDRQQYSRAIALYLEQHTTGDPSAVMSLLMVGKQLLGAGPEVLKQVAADPLPRQVVTAYAVSGGGPRYAYRYAPEAGMAEAWLTAVEAACVGKVEGADRLAWLAYQAGQMETCERWLEKVGADSGIAQWLRAKLLLRAGKAEQAAAVLAEVVRLFPREEHWHDISSVFPISPPEEEWHRELIYVDYFGYGFSPSAWAQAELGVLRLARRQYAEAIDCLLRGGFWMDAAHVAERVLTPDELKAYVDRHWPESAERGKQDNGASRAESENEESEYRHGHVKADRIGQEIRYLLARRLTRIGRWKQARAYYPPEFRPRLDAYIQGIRAGHDQRRSRRERAASLFEAATIARYDGMELLGTELEPDWFAIGGSFELEPLSTLRGQATDSNVQLVASSADERRRLKQHAVDPEQRYHYRYVAADHAWAAAQLMPDGDDETARMLCLAGTWLKYEDPKAADRFYKALVRRCGNTELGREADRRRWFPPIKEPRQE